MKVKVVKKFRDKYTKKIYKVNEELELKEERVKEILKKGPYVEVVKMDETETADELEETSEAEDVLEIEE